MLDMGKNQGKRPAREILVGFCDRLFNQDEETSKIFFRHMAEVS